MHKHILLSQPCKVLKAQLNDAVLRFEEVNMSTKLCNGIQRSVELKQQPADLQPTHRNTTSHHQHRWSSHRNNTSHHQHRWSSHRNTTSHNQHRWSSHRNTTSHHQHRWSSHRNTTSHNQHRWFSHHNTTSHHQHRWSSYLVKQSILGIAVFTQKHVLKFINVTAGKHSEFKPLSRLNSIKQI